MELDLAKIFPIQQIENSVIINGNGDLTLGFRLNLPEVYTLDGSGYEQLNENFTSILRMLPVGSIYHQQDFIFVKKFDSAKAAEKINNLSFVDKNNLIYYDTKPVVSHYTNIYVTIKNEDKRAEINSVLSPKDYIFKKPFKNLDEKLELLSSVTETILNGFNAIKGCSVRQLSDNELGCAIYDYFNLSYQNPLTSGFEKKSLQPVGIENDYIKIGDQFVKIISLIGEPEKIATSKIPNTAPGNIYSLPTGYNNAIQLQSSYFFPIALGLPIDHIVNTFIEITDNEQIIKELSVESQKLSFLAGIGYMPAKAKKDMINEFITTITYQDYSTARTGLNVILHNSDLRALKKDLNLTLAAFSKIGDVDVWVENFDTLRLFFGSMPGNSRFYDRKFINVVDMAVCYLPKENQYYEDKDGFLFQDRYGNPIFVNMWDSPHIVNRNKVVFGPSGSGKSFFINYLVDQSLSAGNHVVIMDIGASYEKSVKINGGKYYDSSNRDLFSFNVFLGSITDQEDYEDKINFIYSLLRMIWRSSEKVTNEEKTILKKIIKGYFSYFNEKKLFPDLIGFYNYIDVFRKENKDTTYDKYFDYDSLKLNLEPYVSGEYKYLLNAKENIDITGDRFIVFELESVKGNDDLFNIISLVITNLVTEKIKKLDGVKKSFIIDEALDFLKSDIGEFIAYLYRTFRKKGGEVYIAAQNVEFLKSANPEVMRSIVGNTDTKILLDHSNYKSSYKDLQQMLSLTDYDITILDSLQKTKQYREFFIKMGNNTRVFRLDVSDVAKAVYTTDPYEKTAINKELEKTGDLKSAIFNYINKKQ